MYVLMLDSQCSSLGREATRSAVIVSVPSPSLVGCYCVCTQTMVSTVSYSLSPSSPFLLSEHRITQKEGPLSGFYEGDLDSLFLLYCRGYGIPGMEIPKGLESQDENIREFSSKSLQGGFKFKVTSGLLRRGQDTNKYTLKLRGFTVPGEDGGGDFPSFLFLILLSTFSQLQNISVFLLIRQVFYHIEDFLKTKVLETTSLNTSVSWFSWGEKESNFYRQASSRFKATFCHKVLRTLLSLCINVVNKHGKPRQVQEDSYVPNGVDEPFQMRINCCSSWKHLYNIDFVSHKKRMRFLCHFSFQQMTHRAQGTLVS